MVVEVIVVKLCGYFDCKVFISFIVCGVVVVNDRVY